MGLGEWIPQVGRCLTCNKNGYASRTVAKKVVKSMTRERPDPNLMAYECPEGLWHVGHPNSWQRRLLELRKQEEQAEVDRLNTLPVTSSGQVIALEVVQADKNNPGKGLKVTELVPLTHDRLPGVKIFLMEVTPDIASEWLKLNTPGQRKISATAVGKYAVDMAGLEWYFTGDPVRISNKGLLIDGQHRLTAIIESDESQLLVVIFGVEHEAIQAIDSGNKRSYANVLQMQDPPVRESLTVAGLVSRVFHWWNGNYGVNGLGRTQNAPYTSVRPTIAQLEAIRHQVEAELGVTMEYAAILGKKCAKLKPGIAPSVYGLVWLVLSAIDKDLREGFFHELMVEPKSPSADYPINVLTNALYRRQKRAVGENKLTDVQQIHYLFTTYNYWLDNKPLMTMRSPAPARWDTVAQPRVQNSEA